MFCAFIRSSNFGTGRQASVRSPRTYEGTKLVLFWLAKRPPAYVKPPPTWHRWSQSQFGGMSYVVHRVALYIGTFGSRLPSIGMPAWTSFDWVTRVSRYVMPAQMFQPGSGWPTMLTSYPRERCLPSRVTMPLSGSFV